MNRVFVHFFPPYILHVCVSWLLHADKLHTWHYILAPPPAYTEQKFFEVAVWTIFLFWENTQRDINKTYTVYWLAYYNYYTHKLPAERTILVFYCCNYFCCQCVQKLTHHWLTLLLWLFLVLEPVNQSNMIFLKQNILFCTQKTQTMSGPVVYYTF